MTSLHGFAHDPHAFDVADGHVLFNQDEPGNTMYVLLEGAIELQVNGKFLTMLEPGEMFGEMALTDAHPRSATAIARGATRLVPIDQKRFMYLVQNTPYFAIEVMHSMAERLRMMDARI
jgi:CRP-like cAMP-binding protein